MLGAGAIAPYSYPYDIRRPVGVQERSCGGDALRRDLASGVGMSREPGVGQEFREPASGMGRQTTAVNIFLRRSPQVDKRFRAAFPGFLER
jgi:hypothetical protein